MNPTPSQIEELEKLANAATPGPWAYEDDSEGSSMGWIVHTPDARLSSQAIFEVCGDSAQQAMNAEFVAAANPAVILALSARCKALEEEAREARDRALDDAAKLCVDFSWAADIDWWLNATKKDVSAKSCLECAAPSTLMDETQKASPPFGSETLAVKTTIEC